MSRTHRPDHPRRHAARPLGHGPHTRRPGEESDPLSLRLLFARGADAPHDLDRMSLSGDSSPSDDRWRVL